MSIIKARPTVYKGIRMRSRLEADFAASLERGNDTWTYEPKCFAGPTGQWLPDFEITSVPNYPWYVEVKPELLITTGFESVLKKMEITWLSEPDALLELVFWRYGLDSVLSAVAVVARGTGSPWELWISPRMESEMPTAVRGALAKAGLL